MSGELPVHVRSGGFKVDRAEALRKLSGYQLSDPLSFLACWVRSAVASGAPSVAVWLDTEGVGAWFEGEPWTAEQLADPYTYFFEAEGPKAAPVRHAVVGALAAFRAGVRTVRIESGVGSLRQGALLGPDSVSAGPSNSSRGTVLRAEWSASIPEADRLRAVQALEARCGMLRIPVSIARAGGAPKRPGRISAESRFPALEFERDLLRGVLFLPTRPDAPSSEVHLYSGGVLASTIEWQFPRAQAQAHLDDSAFVLDASHSSVTLNAEFQKAMSEAGERADGLLDLALTRHERQYWRLTRFLFEGHLAARVLRRLKWHRDGLLDFLLAAAVGRAEDREKLLTLERGIAAWLRATAAGMSDEYRDRPLVKRLFDAPLYLTVTGETISVSELEKVKERVGLLPVCHLPFPGLHLDPPVLWCPARTDPVLERRFGDAVRWYDDVETFRELKVKMNNGPDRRLQKRSPPKN